MKGILKKYWAIYNKIKKISHMKVRVGLVRIVLKDQHVS